ncbi:MAG TPA: hypothetical protein VJ725_02780 [Thermoanaerobaculia bacterium]|nr:hypothetical protein [Thermoanaerobaculia bacterium]
MDLLSLLVAREGRSRVLDALAGQGWSVAESKEGALPAPEPQAG